MNKLNFEHERNVLQLYLHVLYNVYMRVNFWREKKLEQRSLAQKKMNTFPLNQKMSSAR